MTEEAVKDIRNSTDFKRLKELVTPLLGQRCLRAELSYAGELEVHFGVAIPYRHPKLAGQSRGTWVLEALATPWILSPAEEGGASYVFGLVSLWHHSRPVPMEVFKERVSSLLGGKIISALEVTPDGDLALEFEENLTLRLLAKYAPPDPELPVWELAAPEHRFLQVWGAPAPGWSWLRSDVPLC